MPDEPLIASVVPIASAPPRWDPRSVALIVLVWLILHIGCLFTPGLLDDVDSVYTEIAREMLVRHDYVTPYVDGVRFFDKPPLMYWLAAGSMRVFGEKDWAARLPLALLTLALFLAVYALGLRLFREPSRCGDEDSTLATDRAALYSALALATSIGPFLYTRFFIPDILICLWLTLAIHAFLIALERIQPQGRVPHVSPLRHGFAATNSQASALLPCLAFAAVTALNLLTKGFIGLVFPIAFVLLYLGLTRQLSLLRKLHLVPSALVFLAIAAPWHILAALRNPAIELPVGLGLPARAGWAWFYLYNEHIARFLQRRIPHDYGQVPVWLFWLLAALWLFPWTAFLPPAISQHIRELRAGVPAPNTWVPHLSDGTIAAEVGSPQPRQTARTLLLWAGLVLLFFTFSARQEYYSLPALPALALMAGGLLARAECTSGGVTDPAANRAALKWHLWLLVPIGALAAAIALFFAIAAPHTDPSTDIATLLAQGGNYNLSLSHIFDLTAAAMGLFRAPLVVVGLSMATIGPLTYLMRRARHTFAANLTLSAAAICLLLCIHEGLVRFSPTLGSKELANAILQAQRSTEHGQRTNAPDLILIDGELTAGSTLLFYTHQPVHVVDARVNGLWYGGFWPDAPALFETDATLHQLWAGPRRLFLLTYHPAERATDLARFGPVHTLAAAGGKSILTNQ
jgi:4-amino-4-deoxy-L-arabinose transferase-like glycosyltransferase